MFMDTFYEQCEKKISSDPNHFILLYNERMKVFNVYDIRAFLRQIQDHCYDLPDQMLKIILSRNPSLN